MIRKNDRLTVTIEDYSNEGHGVARKDGYVLFIPGAAVGETLEVHVLKTGRSFGYAKIVRILTPSPDRTECDCEVASRCGGCSFRHIRYESELMHKAAKVENALRRIGGIACPPMQPILAAHETCSYRNKAQYPIREENGNIVAGFYASGSHRIIQTDRCPLQPEIFDKLLHFTLEYIQSHALTAYNEQTGKGLVRHLYLRRGEKSGEIMVCVVLNGDSLPEDFLPTLTAAFPEVKCVCVNENRQKTNVILGKNTHFLTERTFIYDSLLGKEFAISPASFYQVNPVQTERLYQKAADLAEIDETQTVLDLYCGIGTIGICTASNAKTLVGIEIVPEAVENATINAKRNGLQNTRYLCADAKNGAAQLIAEGYRFDTVIIDPPRKGCDTQTLEALVTLAPPKLVYISCDPATLARDIAYLTKHGFSLKSATPVDLFPRTTHVETVALLTLEKVDDKIQAFFENAQLLSENFNITPLLYGSLGLEYLSGQNLGADDIDILVPEILLSDKWTEFRSTLESNAYTLVDEHEHTFEKNSIHYSYAKIEELPTFANIALDEIKTRNHEGTSFKVLSLQQYLKVYTASSKDGYRATVRGKKDADKLAFINQQIKNKEKS